MFLQTFDFLFLESEDFFLNGNIKFSRSTANNIQIPISITILT